MTDIYSKLIHVPHVVRCSCTDSETSARTSHAIAATPISFFSYIPLHFTFLTAPVNMDCKLLSVPFLIMLYFQLWSSSYAAAQTDVSSIITSTTFDQFLSRHTDGSCPASGFYTYDSFITAVESFSGFGTTGDADIQKRELAAFFAHVAHETSAGCYKEEMAKGNYCSTESGWTCASGKQYYGRGPLQLTWNYNYGLAGQYLGFDGINNPDIIASNAVLSVKSAAWFWMTQQSPTCHEAMAGNEGFGATTRVINGGIECNQPSITSAQQDRINLYESFCQILGVQPGDNLRC